MKRALLVLSLSGLLFMTGTGLALSQEEPKPQKDTVNMDTDAKPTFYYATEEEKAAESGNKGSSPATIAIIIGAVIVVVGVAVILLKKKK